MQVAAQALRHKTINADQKAALLAEREAILAELNSEYQPQFAFAN